LIHVEKFQNKTEALAQERYYKSSEGGNEMTGILRRNGILNMERRLGSWLERP
jgi:hypothetical protein